MKHLWQSGSKREAFNTLSKFVVTQAGPSMMYGDPELGGEEEEEDASGSDKLLAR